MTCNRIKVLVITGTVFLSVLHTAFSSPGANTCESVIEKNSRQVPAQKLEYKFSEQQDTLSTGIIWWHASFDSLFGAPQYLNVLIMDADTAAERFRLEAADRITGNNRLTASEFARHFNPLAVINAGFFSAHPEYVSSGIFKYRGEVYPFMKEEPAELQFVGSSAIGIDKDGNWIFYNRESNYWPDDWPRAHTALAGAHRLLEDGHIPMPVADESYVTDREKRHAGLRHPRTAICLTGASEIIILVADGRHEEAVGLSLFELATVMQKMGCTDAVNLDGGGSSTMHISGHGLVNHPSGNQSFDHEGERAVRTVIMIE